MIDLDLRTVVVIYLGTSVVGTLLLVQLWRQNRGRFAGVELWFGSAGLQTLGLFLIATRDVLPDWLSVIGANTLIGVGLLMIYVGLERYVGKIGKHLHDYVLLAACILDQVFHTLVAPDLMMRVLIFSIFQLVIAVECAWLLWSRAAPVLRPLVRGIGIVFAGYGMANVIRIADLLLGTPTGNDFFSSGAFQVLMVVGYLILFILLIFELVLTVSRRLILEIDVEREKFAIAFNSVPYATILTRLSDGSIVEVNEGFESMTGYHRDEVIAKTTMEMHLWEHAEDRASMADAISRTGKVTGKEAHFRKKSGERVVGLLSAQGITIDGEKCLLSCIADIGERKAIEVALQQESQALQQRNEELVRFNRLAVGREMDMIRLKQQVNALSSRLGLVSPHVLDFVDAPESATDGAALAPARKS